jgi:hypothetical protein
MKDYYAWEKFSGAVRGMVTGTTTIQQRLGNAYVFHLVHVDPKKLPEDIRADFIQMKERLKTVVAPVAGDGSIQATVSNLSDEEASEIASHIVDMFFRVESDFRGE